MRVQTEEDAKNYLETYFPKYKEVISILPGTTPSNPKCSVGVGGAFGWGDTWSEAVRCLLKDDAIHLYLPS